MNSNGDSQPDEVQLVEPEKKFLTSGDLKAMGFTRAFIEKFLTPISDGDITGPYVSESSNFRSSTRLYSAEEVKRALKLPLVREWLLKSKHRREATDARKQEMLNNLLGTKITVDALPLEELTAEAVENYNHINDRHITRGTKTALTVDGSDRHTVLTRGRIVVQHIRHNHTNYDELWQPLRGKPGSDDAYEIILRKTAEAMKQEYPSLAPFIDYQVHTKDIWTDEPQQTRGNGRSRQQAS